MGNTLIKISVIYFLIGITLGLYMSIGHDYVLTGVHVHINLLGWVSLAIAGIFYKLFPHLAQSATAKVHFWLHNIGLPVMMISLAFVVTGAGGLFTTLLSIGGVVTVLAIYFFSFNILSNLDKSP
jgi:cbb3-type cytochrome oxidase subunit 1